MKKRTIYIINILIPLIVGGISALISMNGMDAFEAVNKSALNPPNIVFPIVWTILYTLMGIGMGLVYNSRCNTQNKSLSVIFYALQLAFNFCWSIVFFNLQAYLFAFIWLILLIVLVVIMMYYFYQCKPVAAYLQIPYLIWLLFAAYLNFTIYLLN